MKAITITLAVSLALPLGHANATPQDDQFQKIAHDYIEVFLAAQPEKRFFVASERRRMTAEQVVDSLFAATGQRIEVEEITFDPEAKRPASSMISLASEQIRSTSIRPLPSNGIAKSTLRRKRFAVPDRD